MSTKTEEELTTYYTNKYPLTFTEDFSETDTDLTRLYQEAWELAKRSADLLKKSFGAKRVVVFGSLTKRSWFTRWSDVDIAAWGVPNDKFYAAVGAVTGLTTDFKVDLVDAGECRDSLRKAIEAEGIEI